MFSLMWTWHFRRVCLLLPRYVHRASASGRPQIACIWRLIVDIEGSNEDPDNQSWITAYQAGVDSQNTGQVYCLSMYWAIMTITTVGYGDVVRAASLSSRSDGLWQLRETPLLPPRCRC